MKQYWLHGARPDGSHLWMKLDERGAEPEYARLLREHLPPDIVWSCAPHTNPLDPRVPEARPAV